MTPTPSWTTRCTCKYLWTPADHRQRSRWVSLPDDQQLRQSGAVPARRRQDPANRPCPIASRAMPGTGGCWPDVGHACFRQRIRLRAESRGGGITGSWPGGRGLDECRRRNRWRRASDGASGTFGSTTTGRNRLCMSRFIRSTAHDSTVESRVSPNADSGGGTQGSIIPTKLAATWTRHVSAAGSRSGSLRTRGQPAVTTGRWPSPSPEANCMVLGADHRTANRDPQTR